MTLDPLRLGAPNSPRPAPSEDESRPEEPVPTAETRFPLQGTARSSLRALLEGVATSKRSTPWVARPVTQHPKTEPVPEAVRPPSPSQSRGSRWHPRTTLRWPFGTRLDALTRGANTHRSMPLAGCHPRRCRRWQRAWSSAEDDRTRTTANRTRFPPPQARDLEPRVGGRTRDAGRNGSPVPE